MSDPDNALMATFQVVDSSSLSSSGGSLELHLEGYHRIPRGCWGKLYGPRGGPTERTDDDRSWRQSPPSSSAFCGLWAASPSEVERQRRWASFHPDLFPLAGPTSLPKTSAFRKPQPKSEEEFDDPVPPRPPETSYFLALHSPTTDRCCLAHLGPEHDPRSQEIAKMLFWVVGDGVANLWLDMQSARTKVSEEPKKPGDAGRIRETRNQSEPPGSPSSNGSSKSKRVQDETQSTLSPSRDNSLNVHVKATLVLGPYSPNVDDTKAAFNEFVEWREVLTPWLAQCVQIIDQDYYPVQIEFCQTVPEAEHDRAARPDGEGTPSAESRRNDDGLGLVVLNRDPVDEERRLVCPVVSTESLRKDKDDCPSVCPTVTTANTESASPNSLGLFRVSETPVLSRHGHRPSFQEASSTSSESAMETAPTSKRSAQLVARGSEDWARERIREAICAFAGRWTKMSCLDNGWAPVFLSFDGYQALPLPVLGPCARELHRSAVLGLPPFQLRGVITHHRYENKLSKWERDSVQADGIGQTVEDWWRQKAEQRRQADLAGLTKKQRQRKREKEKKRALAQASSNSSVAVTANAAKADDGLSTPLPNSDSPATDDASRSEHAQSSDLTPAQRRRAYVLLPNKPKLNDVQWTSEDALGLHEALEVLLTVTASAGGEKGRGKWCEVCGATRRRPELDVENKADDGKTGDAAPATAPPAPDTGPAKVESTVAAATEDVDTIKQTSPIAPDSPSTVCSSPLDTPAQEVDAAEVTPITPATSIGPSIPVSPLPESDVIGTEPKSETERDGSLPLLERRDPSTVPVAPPTRNSSGASVSASGPPSFNPSRVNSHAPSASASIHSTSTVADAPMRIAYLPLQTCGPCQGASYCSKAHQLADWPNHKEWCKAHRIANDPELARLVRIGQSQQRSGQDNMHDDGGAEQSRKSKLVAPKAEDDHPTGWRVRHTGEGPAFAGIPVVVRTGFERLSPLGRRELSHDGTEVRSDSAERGTRASGDEEDGVASDVTEEKVEEVSG